MYVFEWAESYTINYMGSKMALLIRNSNKKYLYKQGFTNLSWKKGK